MHPPKAISVIWHRPSPFSKGPVICQVSLAPPQGPCHAAACLSVAFNSLKSLVPKEQCTSASSLSSKHKPFRSTCFFLFYSVSHRAGERTQGVPHGRQMFYDGAIHTLPAPQCPGFLSNVECASIPRGGFLDERGSSRSQCRVCSTSSSLPKTTPTIPCSYDFHALSTAPCLFRYNSESCVNLPFLPHS